MSHLYTMLPTDGSSQAMVSFMSFIRITQVGATYTYNLSGLPSKLVLDGTLEISPVQLDLNTCISRVHGTSRHILHLTKSSVARRQNWSTYCTDFWILSPSTPCRIWCKISKQSSARWVLTLFASRRAWPTSQIVQATLSSYWPWQSINLLSYSLRYKNRTGRSEKAHRSAFQLIAL